LFFGGLIGAHVPEWTAEQNLQFFIRPYERHYANKIPNIY